MTFKDAAEKILNEIEGKVVTKPVKRVDDNLDTVLESLDLEIEDEKVNLELNEEFDFDVSDVKKESKKVERVVNENTALDFVGSFTYAPNPMEYPKNALYKNINEGKVYIRNDQGLWESFIQDGKQGAQGQRGGGVPGGGVGVKECISLINTNAPLSLTPFRMNTDTSGNTQILTLSISGGQRVTSALPTGPSYLFQYSGTGPFNIKTGTSVNISATSADFVATTGLRETLYITDSYISVYATSAGSVTIVGGTGV